MNIAKPSTPGTIAKATGMPGMMKGSASNPMSMGAVAKGASLPPLAPLSMPAMPPFQVADSSFCFLKCFVSLRCNSLYILAVHLPLKESNE